jgi:hypothetical protein
MKAGDIITLKDGRKVRVAFILGTFVLYEEVKP